MMYKVMSIQQVSPTDKPTMLMMENILLLSTLRHAVFKYVLNIQEVFCIIIFLPGTNIQRPYQLYMLLI